MAQLQYLESWGDDTTGAISGSGSSLNVYLSSEQECEKEEYKLIPDDID